VTSLTGFRLTPDQLCQLAGRLDDDDVPGVAADVVDGLVFGYHHSRPCVTFLVGDWIVGRLVLGEDKEWRP
jgi:hypothetical protein